MNNLFYALILTIAFPLHSMNPHEIDDHTPVILGSTEQILKALRKKPDFHALAQQPVIMLLGGEKADGLQVENAVDYASQKLELNGRQRQEATAAIMSTARVIQAKL